MGLDNILVSLDLEMNQPSGKIIQIGAAIGNLESKTIIDSFSVFINTHEILSEFIIGLTGITQQDVDGGVSLIEGYKALVDFAVNRYNCHPMVVEWGQGDCRCLKEQLKSYDNLIEWRFGRTSMNAKNIHQFKQLQKKSKTQGGLARALGRHQLAFKGKKHNAKDDAINTLLLFFKMLDER